MAIAAYFGNEPCLEVPETVLVLEPREDRRESLLAGLFGELDPLVHGAA